MSSQEIDYNCNETDNKQMEENEDENEDNDLLTAPWETMFDPVRSEQLKILMHELQITRANQNFDHLCWVQTWMNAIPTQYILQLMDVFFDKWQEVLYHWLCSRPNFKEVVKWYLGWKELLPPKLMANGHVRFRLNIGLEMMSQAVEGLEFETQNKTAPAPAAAKPTV